MYFKIQIYICKFLRLQIKKYSFSPEYLNYLFHTKIFQKVSLLYTELVFCFYKPFYNNIILRKKMNRVNACRKRRNIKRFKTI